MFGAAALVSTRDFLPPKLEHPVVTLALKITAASNVAAPRIFLIGVLFEFVKIMAEAPSVAQVAQINLCTLITPYFRNSSPSCNSPPLNIMQCYGGF